MKDKRNPLIFPLACFVMSTIMYFIAFHQQRNLTERYKQELDKTKELFKECRDSKRCKL